MRWVKVRWTKGSRYYEVHLHQDLWEQWVLTRVWGRRGSALGQVRNMPCDSYEDGLAWLEQVERRRVQRGYSAVDRDL